MNIKERATLIADAVMQTHGSTATYMPVFGRTRTCIVCVRRRPQIIPGLVPVLADGEVIEVRRSDLDVDPQPGDIIQVLDGTWSVRSAKPKNVAEVMWELDCVPHAS